MNREYDLLQHLMLAASRHGSRLFRNNTGLGWVGTPVKRTASSITLLEPRPLHAGLCTGSSDLIGWKPVTITPDMVGTTVAVFVAAEAKTGKVPVTEDQKKFLSAVKKAGGIGGVVYSEDELLSLLMT